MNVARKQIFLRHSSELVLQFAPVGYRSQIEALQKFLARTAAIKWIKNEKNIFQRRILYGVPVVRNRMSCRPFKIKKNNLGV